MSHGSALTLGRSVRSYSASDIPNASSHPPPSPGVMVGRSDATVGIVAGQSSSKEADKDPVIHGRVKVGLSGIVFLGNPKARLATRVLAREKKKRTLNSVPAQRVKKSCSGLQGGGETFVGASDRKT